MMTERFPYEEVKNKIENANAITILSHLNPDADTLGTALGIYALLSQDKSKKVEVVNASNELPRHLDFLPYFHKIKHHIDYADSLIFTCDAGSVDRLGFDLSGRDIINIDHHQSNTRYGTVNVIDADHASASQVAYTLFREICEVKKEAATCFYAALLSDTRYFTTTSMNQEVFNVARDLVKAGAVPSEIAYHFTQRRPLSSLRILQKALASLSLHHDARIATMMVTKRDREETGATVPDLEGIVDYGRSLATVEVSLFAMELDSGIRISLRSKKADVSKVAMAFGGGGHKVASGFTLTQFGLQESIDTILKKIEELGILDEK
ncbi:MAG TPA: DHH family phosphoesterase [Sulfurovum sp.]